MLVIPMYSLGPVHSALVFDFSSLLLAILILFPPFLPFLRPWITTLKQEYKTVIKKQKIHQIMNTK